MRSATAQKIFESDERFWVDSAGIHQSADTVLEPEHLEWADVILVMENSHRKFISQTYPELFRKRKIVCLAIPDEFRFMQPELISILEEKVEHAYQNGLLTLGGA